MGCAGSRSNISVPTNAAAGAVEELPNPAPITPSISNSPPISAPLTPTTSTKKNSLAASTNHLILSKFVATTFSGIVVDSNLPQLIVGRIGGMVSDIRTPYSSKLCALYRMDVQVRSRQDPKIWEQKYSEVKSSDFFLVDPQNPKEKLYISGNEYVIELISNPIDSGSSEGFQILDSTESISGPLKTIFQKAGIDESSVIRIREEIYQVNTQLAVFGVVELGHQMYGKNARRLVPSTEQSITEEYRLIQNWTHDDMRQWRQLFSSGPSRLFISDSPQAFQGIIVDLIVAKPATPIPHSNSGDSVNKDLPPPPPQPPHVTSVGSATTVVQNSSKSDNSRKPETTTSSSSSSTSSTSVQKSSTSTSVATDQNKKSGSSSRLVLVQVPDGAAPGTTVRVPGPDGNSMLIDIPPNAKPGDVVEVVVR